MTFRPGRVRGGQGSLRVRGEEDRAPRERRRAGHEAQETEPREPARCAFLRIALTGVVRDEADRTHVATNGSRAIRVHVAKPIRVPRVRTGATVMIVSMLTRDD